MKKKIFVFILPFIGFAGCYITSVLFLHFIDVTGFMCPIKLVTGYLCPGCGATRALRALLDFDIILSLRSNPTIIISVICMCILYIRILLNTFGAIKKIIPENKVFYFVLAGIIFSYLFIRNFIPALQPLLII